MRLGQLARKVSVRPSDVVEFLAKRGVLVEEHANSRIEESDAQIVLEHFAPHLLILQPTLPTEQTPVGTIVEDFSENLTLSSNDDESSVEASFSEPGNVESALQLQAEASSSSSVSDLDGSDQALPEVIKAPKVELKGLTVIGRIELPQPKKKEEAPVVDQQETQQEELQKKHNRPDRNRQRSGNRRSFKNPVAEERERMEREALELKRVKAEEEKRRRKEYYEKKVKPGVPSKSVRLVDEPLTTLSQETPAEPKTWFGKFLRWLTTY